MLAFYSISILHCVIKSTLLAAYVRRGLLTRLAAKNSLCLTSGSKASCRSVFLALIACR
jgi:hypothetical protein